MNISRTRAGFLLLMPLLALVLGGCSLLGSMRPASPEITAPDTTAVRAEPEPEPTETPKPVKAAPATRSPAPAPPDTAAVTVPERAPTVTIRLSAEERAAREAKFRDDVDRATRSLTLVRARILTKTDQQELSAADQFLADALRAFEASDLTRACTVAEKARVLAEELRTRVAPP